jgi:N-acyl-D-amino-acid deacylase
MHDHDLIIRNGTVVDGTGAPKRKADVAINGGVIVAVGEVPGRGKREIDATGLLVTPGWVDAHTHFDGQVMWDSYLTPSCWHGVTTVVMGNCGVGFAPAKPDDREVLIDMMEGVEDIPNAVLTEGLKWEWETFPEYMDTIAARSLVLDVAAQVPHAAVRVYVMGERGARNEPATPEEIEKMSIIVKEALTAGAVGFSSSRSQQHLCANGSILPGSFVAPEELYGFGRAIEAAGHGFFELSSDLGSAGMSHGTDDDELEWMTRISTGTGTKVGFALGQLHSKPERWRHTLTKVETAQHAGAEIIVRVPVRAIGLVMSWETTYHPFVGRSVYDEIARLGKPQRLGMLRDPQVRQRILAQKSGKDPFIGFASRYDCMFRLEEGKDLNYEPTPENSVQAQAGKRGVNPDEIIYDIFMENDGHGYLYAPLVGYAYNNLDSVYELMLNPTSVIAAGDAGAHCGNICDASSPTFMLTFWTRDRVRGPRLPIERAVQLQARRTAEVFGLFDRGLIAQGKKADINLIDYDRLRILPPTMAYDLPAGGRRLIQKAEGYRATIVSGVVTFENGEPTGAMPGTVVRAGQIAVAAVTH